MVSGHLVLPGFVGNGDTGAEGRGEAKESKSLNECSFQNDPTLFPQSLLMAHSHKM